LENVHQQMALQKLEISHLQEGVNVALDLAHTNFNQYSGQQLSAVRGISDALVQDEADYNNVSAAPDSPPAVSAVDRLAARLGGPRPGSSHSSKRLPALDPDYRSNSSKLHKSHSAAANLGKKKKYRI
jgi:hypothetical protein